MPIPSATDMSVDSAANQESLAVIAYRMGAVERHIESLIGRFDTVAQYYVTNATLMLTLDPVKERLHELETNEKERDRKRGNEQAQFKLAVTIAILSPIFSAIVSLLVVAVVNK